MLGNKVAIEVTHTLSAFPLKGIHDAEYTGTAK